jgi:ATP-dependent Lon protease
MTEEKQRKTGKKKAQELENTGSEEKELELELENEELNNEDEFGESIEEEIEDAISGGKNSIRSMPMIPLRGLSIFPYMVLHFDIGREKSISALEKAMMMKQLVFLSAQKDAETDLPTHEDFYKVGTIAKIKQMLKLPGDAIRVLVEGFPRSVMAGILLPILALHQ